MKILSIANISNFDDINSDSGYIFNYLLANEFIKDNNEFAIVLPVGLNNVENFKDCKIYYSDIGTTKYSSRFAFNWDSFAEIINEYNPDLIFLNQCELTSAIKALLISNKNYKTKILTYCHYPALHVDESQKSILDYSLNNEGLCETIIYNILTAVNVADFFVTQSNFAKNLLMDYAAQHNVELRKEIHIITPPLDPTFYNKKERDFSSGNNIVYNHRLYQSYGTEFLTSLIKSNSAKQFLVLDPMSNRAKNRTQFNNTPFEFVQSLKSLDNVKVFNGSESRLKYKEYIENGDIAVGCYRKACVWSMAAVDCLSVGIPVVAPNFAAYPEFIPDYLRFNSLEEANRIIDKLFKDKDFYKKAVIDSRKVLDDLHPNRIHQKFKEMILGV